MAIKVNPNETPDEDRECGEVSTSEVPINHMMDTINDTDSDFEASNDETDDRMYELLATNDNVDNEDIGQQNTTYYPHNYLVQWVDWDQFDHSLQQTNDANESETIQSEDTSVAQEVNQLNNTTCSQTNCSSDVTQISLTNDRINEIKGLMSGFDLPKDNIPVWAQDMAEDQWKTYLKSKLDDKQN